MELVSGFFDDLNRGDLEAMAARLAPGFEMTVPPEMGLEPRTYRGPDGFREWFSSFSEVMEIRVEPHEFVPVGDSVVAPHTLHARGRETGIESGQYTAQVWRIRDGLADRVQVYATMEQAMSAAEAAD